MSERKTDPQFCAHQIRSRRRSPDDRLSYDRALSKIANSNPPWTRATIFDSLTYQPASSVQLVGFPNDSTNLTEPEVIRDTVIEPHTVR